MKCMECGCSEEVHSEDQAALMPCAGCRECSGFKSKKHSNATGENISGVFEVSVRTTRWGGDQHGEKELPPDDADSNIKCRQHFDSFHVEYVTKEDTEEREVENTTHQKVTPSVEEYAEEDKSEVGWVVSPDEESHQIRIDIYRDCEGELLVQYLEPETCLQIADMFRSAAELALKMKKAAEENSDKDVSAGNENFPAAVQSELFGGEETDRRAL